MFSLPSANDFDQHFRPYTKMQSNFIELRYWVYRHHNMTSYINCVVNISIIPTGLAYCQSIKCNKVSSAIVSIVVGGDFVILFKYDVVLVERTLCSSVRRTHPDQAALGRAQSVTGDVHLD